MLKAKNNIAISLGKGLVTALTLLNLSAAFDTIDLTLHELTRCRIGMVFIMWLWIRFRPI